VEPTLLSSGHLSAVPLHCFAYVFGWHSLEYYTPFAGRKFVLFVFAAPELVLKHSGTFHECGDPCNIYESF
jgi:hypothetical protein